MYDEMMRKARNLSISLQGMSAAKSDQYRLNMAIREGRPSLIIHLTDKFTKQWSIKAANHLNQIREQINKKH